MRRVALPFDPTISILADDIPTNMSVGLQGDIEARGVLTKILDTTEHLALVALRLIDWPFLEVDLADGMMMFSGTEAAMQEAIALRSGTVPPDAFVEISVPPYYGVHVREHRDNVYFLWERTSREFPVRYTFLRISISDGKYLPVFYKDDLDSGNDHEINNERLKHSLHAVAANVESEINECQAYGNDARPHGTLTLISAAILRDFWVIEDRQHAFRAGPPRLRKFRGFNGSPHRRVVYLPRCRYNKQHIDRRSEHVQMWKASPHLVQSHFRILPAGHKASEKQRAIAAIHGVEIPADKTWVRGYFGGSNEDQKVYRSRSALYASLEIIGTERRGLVKGLNWFAFERLCESLLRQRGYEIETKVGDAGVDILATDSSGQYVIAQCKHHERPIGPSAVRDLVGARAQYEQKFHVSKTLLMSSSGFTMSAKLAASFAGIECVKVG